ncbi:MAG: 23S rRNA (adenine(2503)-C(2))-methyltransferase RlmN [Oscillospiraceae bacterium]|nr:23S rRNA (adenine(2503)-C(2))-methyltransferase RlmN [Oscillospiraceae bacterium]
MPEDIRSKNFAELAEEIKALNFPSFRAGQIYSWIQEKCVDSFDEMTNISKDLRSKLSERYCFNNCQINTKLVSKIDGTVKYLFSLHDGEYVESVVMKYKYGYSICISTQVGCKMGCTFCASAIGGFVRNLTAGEMLAEIFTAQKDLGIKINHLVLMGTGEPLDNFDNVMRLLELITDEKGQNMSMRHISLSTCGIVPNIYELAEKKLGLTLSVSLHAPNGDIRSKSMPVNIKYDFDELLKACRYYANTTGRRISFEYAMIRGFNDSDECARELAHVLRGMLCHVNLIPVNSVRETEYKKSTLDRQKRFIDILTANSITATVRRTLGSDINASCGQLRASKRKRG